MELTKWIRVLAINILVMQGYGKLAALQYRDLSDKFYLIDLKNQFKKWYPVEDYWSKDIPDDNDALLNWEPFEGKREIWNALWTVSLSSWCWWLYDGDSFMLVFFQSQELISNISKLSPTWTVSNISHRHWYSHFFH